MDRNALRKTASVPLAIALVALAAALIGCAPEPPYVIDERFSINVALPNIRPIHVEGFSPIKKEIYEQNGSPDFMRILWNPQGKPITRIGRTHNQKRQGPVNLGRTWIYLDQGREIKFGPGEEYTIGQISDQTRVLCERGDPEKVLFRPDNRTDPITEWVYYSVGVRYKFDKDGRKKVEPSYFTGVGSRLPE